MAPKQPTLEDLARAEAATAEKRAARRKAYHEGQKKLLSDTPSRFLVLAQQLKEAVSRFNGAARLERQIQFTESTAVATRDVRPGAELVVEVRRDPNAILLAMRSLWRLRADDVFVIEAEGRLGIEPRVDVLAMRIQGVYQGDQLRWRITTGGQEVDTPIDELADRMVAAVATGELSRLWVKAPFLQ